MNGYDKALIEAVKAMRKYRPVHTNGLICHKVAVLHKPEITKSIDIARALGKGVQLIHQIIDRIVRIGK